MDERDADVCVFLPLAGLTTIYALVLDRIKQRAPPQRQIEPNWTWLEVVAGDGLCILAAAIRARLGHPDRATYERSVVLSFVIGGTPIVAWQLWRVYTRQRDIAHTLEHYIDRIEERERDGNHERSQTTLALPRWPRPPASPRNGSRPG